MNESRIQKELIAIAAEADIIKRRSEDLEGRIYRLRSLMEGVSTPSARKGRKKRGLSKEQKEAFIDKYRTRLYKKAAASTGSATGIKQRN